MGDAQADFSEQLDKVEHEAEETLPQAPQKSADQSRFEALLKISPAAAILDSWRELELAIRSLDKSKKAKAGVLMGTLEQLKSAGYIDGPTIDIVLELRLMRNNAAHSTDDRLTAADAERFRSLAERVLIRLDNQRQAD